jgi:hypothetical protein
MPAAASISDEAGKRLLTTAAEKVSRSEHEYKKGQGGEREKHERDVLISLVADRFRDQPRHSLHTHASQRERARTFSGEDAGQVSAEGIVNHRHAAEERAYTSKGKDSLGESTGEK